MNRSEREARQSGEMVTVEELVARLAPALVPVPAGGGIVRPRCRGAKNRDFPLCYPCSQGEAALGGQAVEVLPISMAVARSQLHDHLRQYKRAVDECVRYRSATVLGGLIVAYLQGHQACVGEWDLVCTVPSLKHPGSHPLADLVDRIHGLRERHDRLLVPNAAPGVPDHSYSVDRFLASDRAGGRRVLLIDDTFTTGASIQSAAAVLLASGASSVTALVIGRYIDPDRWPPSKELMDLLSGQQWQASCGVCAPASAGPRNLFG